MKQIPSLLHAAITTVAITLALCCLGSRANAEISDPPSITLPHLEIVKENAKAPATTALAFSADGHLLAVGYETGRVRIYDIKKKQWLRWLDIKSRHGIASLAVSPDGALVATSDGGPSVTLSSCRTGKVVKTSKPATNGIGTVTFTSDGHELVGGGDSAYFWTIPGLRLARTIEIPNGAPYIAVASGRLAVENDQGSVWDIATGTKLCSHALTRSAGPVALSPDGKFVISASGLWDVGKNKHLGDMYVQQGCFGFAPNGDYAVGGCEEDGMYIIDGHTGDSLASTNWATNLSALSHDGKLLAVADFESGITLVTIDIDKARAAAYKKAHPSAHQQANVALINAVMKGDADGVQTALRDGADPNAVVDEHGPPLWECAATDRIDIFEMLIQAGALIRAKDGGARLDILSMSVSSHGGKILAYLAAHGEKIDGVNGPYLLSSAVKQGGEDAVRFLLGDGVPIDSLYDSKTALMIAAESKNPAMIKVLLKCGASTRKLSTDRQESAFDYALASGSPECIRLLLDGAPSYDHFGTTAVAVVRTFDPDLLETMIKLGVDINRHEGGDGATPLIAAMSTGSTDAAVNKNAAACARILLAHGAKVNIKNANGLTALDLCQDPEIEKLLLKNGAVGEYWQLAHPTPNPSAK